MCVIIVVQLNMFDSLHFNIEAITLLVYSYCNVFIVNVM